MVGMECEAIKYTNHAIEFMAKRGITENEAERVILNGEIIEDYPNDKPLPSRLIFLLSDNRPVHLVVVMMLFRKLVLL